MKSRYLVSVLILICFAAVAVVTAAQTSPAQTALELARKTAVVDGDTPAAIKQYQAIVARYGKTDRPAAAMALLRMAALYQKQGSAQARMVLAQLVKDFGDQPAAADARAQLAALNRSQGTSGLTPTPIARLMDSGTLSLSRDERTMAIADWATGDITLRDMATGRDKRLKVIPDAKGPETLAESFDRGVTYWPVPSPDSTQVAYEWEGPFEGTTWATQLRVMPNEPGGKQSILVNNPEFERILPRGWSVDGKKVLVALRKRDQTWVLSWVSTVDRSITQLVSLDWRFGNEDARVNLSRDGRYIAYAALATNPPAPPAKGAVDMRDRHIYVVASDGSGGTELTKTAGVDTDPVWAPDGTRILFVSNRSGGFGLWSIPVRDGKAAGSDSIVRAATGRIDPIAITQAGTLYYFHYTPWVRTVSIVPSGSGKAVTSGANDTIDGQAPSWSVDGKAVAVLRDKQDQPGYTLVIRSVATGDERSYSYDGIVLSAPLWSHDGKRVLVPVADKVEGLGAAPGPGAAPAAPVPAQRAWYAVDRETSSWQKVLDPDPLRGAVVALSPDNRTIYYTARRDTTIRGYGLYMALNLVTGQHTELFDATQAARRTYGPSTVSPDGRMWAILSGTRVIATDGSGVRELSGLSPVSFQWSSDSRALLSIESSVASNGTARPFRVMRIPVAGGPAEFTGIELDAVAVPLVSPDGSRVAVATSTQMPFELWALENVTAASGAPR